MSSELAQRFDVVLQSYLLGEKIRVIAAVSQSFHIGMSEAKDLVEQAPVVLKTGVSQDRADEFKRDLESGYWPGMRNFERLPVGERCCTVEVNESQTSRPSSTSANSEDIAS